MVCSKSKKGHSISSSFISPWMTRKWWIGVNKEYFDRREHIYTRNLERSKRKNIEIERENEERKWKERSFGKFGWINFQNMFGNRVRCLKPIYINLNNSLVIWAKRKNDQNWVKVGDEILGKSKILRNWVFKILRGCCGSGIMWN